MVELHQKDLYVECPRIPLEETNPFFLSLMLEGERDIKSGFSSCIAGCVMMNYQEFCVWFYLHYSCMFVRKEKEGILFKSGIKFKLENIPTKIDLNISVDLPVLKGNIMHNRQLQFLRETKFFAGYTIAGRTSPKQNAKQGKI